MWAAFLGLTASLAVTEELQLGWDGGGGEEGRRAVHFLRMGFLPIITTG